MPPLFIGHRVVSAAMLFDCHSVSSQDCSHRIRISSACTPTVYTASYHLSFKPRVIDSNSAGVHSDISIPSAMCEHLLTSTAPSVQFLFSVVRPSRPLYGVWEYMRLRRPLTALE